MNDAHTPAAPAHRSQRCEGYEPEESMASTATSRPLNKPWKQKGDCVSEGMGQRERSEDESNTRSEMIKLCHTHV